MTIQLASILLERIVLLYNLEPFVSEAHKVLAKQLLLIYELHPHLVVDQQRDLLDYLGNLRTLTTGGEHCYIHLVRFFFFFFFLQRKISLLMCRYG